MKMLKKMLAVLLLVAMVLSLTACGAPKACESCGDTDSKLTKVKHEGESAWLCESCYALYQLAIELEGLY